MSEMTHAAALRAFLRRVGWRTRGLALLRGAAAGLAAGLAAVLIAWVQRGYADDTFRQAALVVGAAAGAAGAAAALLLALRRAPTAAAQVERRASGSRNLILTAAELLDARFAVRPYMRAIVLRDAAAAAAALEPRRLFPAALPLLAVAASAAAWTLTWLLMASRPAALPAALPFTTETPRIVSIDVVITPPAYIGDAAVRLRDPSRIEALAGSRLSITVRAAADAVAVETVHGTQELEAGSPRTFTTELRADADGFLAVEPRSADGGSGARRLIGVTLLPDAAPRVRIAEPGRDLIAPDADITLELDVEAEDDHGLASLVLRYTRVTGFGEQFTFLDGTVPLAIERTDERRWRGRARWALGGLELERGDIVVYRAVAADRRPGGEPGESDTYVVEIGAAHAAEVGGFAGDDEFDRYALSQQMLIVLTERLMARRGSLSADEFTAEALMLAAAQRRVRAEFVFMLGGELEDDDHVEHGIMELHEEAHARADADVLEGRLGNQGRIDLVRAIQAMSHAATLLGDAEMDDALRAEQTALIFLQRAFSRSRYILRAFTEREQLDLSRRLTGSLADAGRHARPARQETDIDPAIAALRRVLADAAALAAAPAPAPDTETARRALDLAQAVLRVDALRPELQETAALFAAAADAADAGRADALRARLDDAVGMLAAYVRAALRDAPPQPRGLDRLEGALVDALRAGGAP